MIRVIVGGLLWVVAVAARADLLDSPQSLEAFFDGAVGAEIAGGAVVGATVILVRDGRLVLGRGYGRADRERGVAVTPDRTLFRIGSVTKLFVWVAVLQQEAAGRLDLAADVDTYLADFEIPPTFPEPVTLRHLMTHTPGFEDRIVGLFARGPRTVGDFHENLIRMRPLRVMMPGRQAAYSNYGAALAAHLVEIAAGTPWDDYLETRILGPLGMERTTGRQPVPRPFDESLAVGYRWKGTSFEPAGFEFVTLPPAGSISSTGNDMAKFMMELLADGDGRVLPAAARLQLFARGFAPEPRVNGMAYGMFEASSHGQRMFGHGGDTLVFHSVLRLYPAERMGLFLSFNSDRGAQARDRVIAAFEDRLFGVPAAPRAAAVAPSVERYVGAYRSLRRPESGPSRLLALLGSFVVTADGEGRLLLPDMGGNVMRWVETESGLFVAEDGRNRVVFVAAPGAERASHLYFDSMPPIGFERVPARDHPLLHQAILGGCIGLLALVAIWPLSSLRRRSRPGVRGESRATLLGAAVAAALLALTWGLATEVEGVEDVVFGFSATFERLLWIPVAIVPFLLALLVATSRAWVRGYWWPTRRIHYTLVTAAAWVYVGWLYYWHVVAIPMPV